jgi:hypothetical protein
MVALPDTYSENFVLKYISEVKPTSFLYSPIWFSSERQLSANAKLRTMKEAIITPVFFSKSLMTILLYV